MIFLLFYKNILNRKRNREILYVLVYVNVYGYFSKGIKINMCF